MKGPSHDLISQAYCKRISILNFSFFFRKESLYEMLLFYKELCGINSCIVFNPKSQRRGKGAHVMHAHFGDVTRLYHSYHIFIIFVNQGVVHESSILVKSEKMKIKVYMYFGKYITASEVFEKSYN